MQTLQLKRYAMAFGTGALMAASVGAFAVDDFPIADIVTKITAIIVAAGAAGAGLMVIAMGWDVGFNIVRKYLKKGSR